MKKLFIYLFIGCLSTSVIAQNERSFTDSINYYLSINGTEAQYSNAIDQLFVMLKQQYVEENVEGHVWETLKSEKETALNQIKVMLASAYRTHFDHEDLKGMIRFYESKAGKQLVEDPTQMSEQQVEEMTAFYSSSTGVKINEQKESLHQMVSEISESWSSQLYLNTKDKLAAKGV